MALSIGLIFMCIGLKERYKYASILMGVGCGIFGAALTNLLK